MVGPIIDDRKDTLVLYSTKRNTFMYALFCRFFVVMPSLIRQDLRLVPPDCEGGRGMSGVWSVYVPHLE
jgi:hypothetical protein